MLCTFLSCFDLSSLRTHLWPFTKVVRKIRRQVTRKMKKVANRGWRGWHGSVLTDLMEGTALWTQLIITVVSLGVIRFNKNLVRRIMRSKPSTCAPSSVQFTVELISDRRNNH